MPPNTAENQRFTAGLTLVQVQQTAACNALHPVEARLSRWLLRARDRLESNSIKLTHEFLSQMLGVRRTTATPHFMGISWV